MKFKNIINLVVLASFQFTSVASSFAQSRYSNSGPDPKTPEGKAFIDLCARLPECSVISNAIMEKQKFRYIFGNMLTRTRFEKNSTKILFIGQDATHIAEASKYPGTSGFGGRVQAIANFFGVDLGVATMNAFYSTINGQYGAFDHIYVEANSNGELEIRQSAFVDSELWLLANSNESAIRKAREEYIEWQIKNNPESLSLMILFGGAARDAFAEFLISRGVKIGTKINSDNLKKIQVPETRLVYAGGNNQFPVPVTKDGSDIYQILFKQQQEQENKKPVRQLDYTNEADQKLAVELVKKAGKKAISLMVFTGGGIHGSGITNAAQLGGYDLTNIEGLTRVEHNGQVAYSLKGLRLSDGTIIQNDIGFVASPHPSALSKMTAQLAVAALKRAFKPLTALKEKLGWFVKPDTNSSGRSRTNDWNEGKEPSYGRAEVPPEHFETGAPDDRRANTADAKRLDEQTIMVGSRGNAKFDNKEITKAKQALPSNEMDPNELFSTHSRHEEGRYVFDRGPGEEIEKLMIDNLDRKKIFEPKPEMKVTKNGQDATLETHGVDGYYAKTSVNSGFFGHYRGDFNKAQTLILADPHGIDDWNTSRALTGERGQRLNGLMNDLGFGENYLVLKTVPFGMDDATKEEWEVIRQRTETYREVLIKKILENKQIKVIFTDGDVAKSEMERILKLLKVTDKKVVNIQRDGSDAASGIIEAGESIKKNFSEKATAKISGKMLDIPRSHLSWASRLWEGTGGDHVINSLGKTRGIVFALVTPDWAAKQKIIALDITVRSINAIKKFAEKMGIRLDRESLPEFLKRKNLNGKYEPNRVGQFTDEIRSTPMKEAPTKKLFDIPSSSPAVQSCQKVFAS